LLQVPGTRPAPRKAFAILVACLCLFAVVFAATAEAQHMHADGSRAAQRCTVCVAAHSPTLLARTASVGPQVGTQPLRLASKTHILPSLSLESDFIRPPPAL